MNKITDAIIKCGDKITLDIKNSFDVDNYSFIAGYKLKVAHIFESNEIALIVYDSSNVLINTIKISFDCSNKFPVESIDIIREIESFGMITFEQFNSKQFKTDAIKWFDNKGTIKINDDINAIILPILYPNNDLMLSVTEAYMGYNVKIINKKIGELDNQNFIFDNYLKTTINELYIPHGNNFLFINDYYNGYTWYLLEISRKEFDNYEKEIMKYIDLWK